MLLLTLSGIVPHNNCGAYSSPPDPGLEKLVDRPYNLRRSRLVDRWLEYSDLEGFTTAGKGVEL